MKTAKRLFAIIIGCIMLSTFGAGTLERTGLLEGTPYEVSAASTMSASQIVKNMGLGWNLGNSLDSNGCGSGKDISYYETYWGNPKVTQELIDTVKARGFNTIRIPVTWYEHLDANNNYKIDEAWLARVKEVVDYAYKNNMYVIINVHHETWINRADMASSYSSMSKELKAVWRQIATYFASYDQHLIFEGMNEPRAKGASDEWWTSDTAKLNVINSLNADFVSTVRSVNSPYKNTRLLMIPGYAAGSDEQMISNITIPSGNDSNGDGRDDYVAVSVHAYKPYDFTMNNSGNHSSFTNEYKNSLDGLFTDINIHLISKGIPVVIGEFSSSNFNNETARAQWAAYYITKAKQLGVPCVLWDNNKDSNPSDPSEAHGYLNRSNNTWYTASDDVIKAMINVMNDSSVVWASGQSNGSSGGSGGQMYNHSSYSSGTTLSVYDDYINGAISQLAANKEIAIKYTSSIPQLALSDSSWGHWTNVSASDFNTNEKIVYFSYESIMNAWSSSNGALANIKIVGAGDVSIPFESAKLLTVPTATQTARPTSTPTAAPTARPTSAPTAAPTAAPTVRPTSTPAAASLNGVNKASDGKYYYYKNGVVDTSFTGLASYNNGWYYFKNGSFDTSYTGMVKHNSKWYYVTNGCLKWGVNGMCKYNGTWYYINNSTFDNSYSGMYKWKGTWYYLTNGVLKWGVSGLTKYNGTWYYIENSTFKGDYTGLVKHGDNWYYVQNSVLYWNVNTCVKYKNKWYYVSNSTVDFSYTGNTTYNGKTYRVVNGVVQL